MDPKTALAGLLGWSPNQQLRNQNLNPAFNPRWMVPEGAPEVAVPQGNTQFDPFIGTGWGNWFDAAGASKPGGMHMDVSKFGTPSSYHEEYDNKTGEGVGIDSFFNPALQGLKQSDTMERKRRERIANVQNIDQENNVGPRRNAYYPNS